MLSKKKKNTISIQEKKEQEILQQNQIFSDFQKKKKGILNKLSAYPFNELENANTICLNSNLFLETQLSPFTKKKHIYYTNMYPCTFVTQVLTPNNLKQIKIREVLDRNNTFEKVDSFLHKREMSVIFTPVKIVIETYKLTLLSSLFLILTFINTFCVFYKYILINIKEHFTDIQKYFYKTEKISVIPLYFLQFVYDLETLYADIPLSGLNWNEYQQKKIVADGKRKIFNNMLNFNITPKTIEKTVEKLVTPTIYSILHNFKQSNETKIKQMLLYLTEKYPQLDQQSINFLIMLFFNYKRLTDEYSKFIIDLASASCLNNSFFMSFLNKTFQNEQKQIEYFHNKQMFKTKFLAEKNSALRDKFRKMFPDKNIPDLQNQDNTNNNNIK